MNVFDLKAERKAELDAAEAILSRAEKDNRALTAAEDSLVSEHMAKVKTLNPEIERREGLCTIRQYDPVALLSGRLVKPGHPDAFDEDGPIARGEHPKALALKRNFSAWGRRVVGNLTGIGADGEIMAAAPSGVISVGAGTGLDSVNFVTPTEILPFMKSYFAFSPFEKAGSTVVSTDHMRNVNYPVVAAGAPPASFAEAQGPASGSSSPFGLSGFTLGANKKSRQVIADWESLQSTEVPMSPIIIDELLASVANALTSDATTALYGALTSPPNFTIVGGVAPCQIGGSSYTADVYGQLTGLRHALVEGLEDPNDCCWMLSRNTLGIIRNTRASTSGVVMFDPESDTILGRKYVVNEYFDSVCGAGFVCYGNWRRGAVLRRTPVLTRVLQELYWLNNEIGFLSTAWADNHFHAELVGSGQPPTWQPIWFTKLPSGSLA